MISLDVEMNSKPLTGNGEGFLLLAAEPGATSCQAAQYPQMFTFGRIQYLPQVGPQWRLLVVLPTLPLEGKRRLARRALAELGRG